MQIVKEVGRIINLILILECYSKLVIFLFHVIKQFGSVISDQSCRVAIVISKMIMLVGVFTEC